MGVEFVGIDLQGAVEVFEAVIVIIQPSIRFRHIPDCRQVVRIVRNSLFVEFYRFFEQTVLCQLRVFRFDRILRIGTV